MKTFKEHISEAFSQGGMPVFQRQWQDQDTIPSAGTALEALNSYIGAIGEHEYMNPRVAFERIQENLSKLGYHFDMPTIDGGMGSYSLPVRYGSGTFELDVSENPYGDFKEGDGISEHIPGGVSLIITVSPVGGGKSMVEAELIRNADVEEDVE